MVNIETSKYIMTKGPSSEGSKDSGKGLETRVITPDSHWTLANDSKFDTSKYSHLFRITTFRLQSSANYISWMTMIQGALRMEDLFEYIDGTLPKPSDEKLIPRWNKANALVALVLNTTMAEYVNLQLSHFSSAAEIWSEARRLYSSQTITDYTL